MSGPTIISMFSSSNEQLPSYATFAKSYGVGSTTKIKLLLENLSKLLLRRKLLLRNQSQSIKCDTEHIGAYTTAMRPLD